jgi:sarcosine/dimethylglycine N-methyltransferase
MSNLNLEAVDVARDYYNSTDADNFYSTIWGGEDIHIGLYYSEIDSIGDASRRTQEEMAAHLDSINSDTTVIDLGSGYGGSARFLAKKYGCHVVALNLSEIENDRARRLNREHGLEEHIDVVDGNFEELDYDDEMFDIVWSQDAFLHSPAREQVVREVSRILKPGGDFIFTDPMQSENCPDDVLQPIFNRIHLESMASPAFYRDIASRNGLIEVSYDELTEHLKRHYSAILEETEKRENELTKRISKEYFQNMRIGLHYWIDGAAKGYLSWGIMHYRKG